MKLTVDRVLAWRMRRQLLDRPASAGVVDIAERLCGLHAQVASCAEHAVAVRQEDPRPGEVAEALASRQLVKTWAMRGTLHLLPAQTAAAYLSLKAAARSWERGAWQRNFASADQVEAMAAAAREVLPGRVLTREQLAAEIVRHTGDPSLADQLGSGWGSLLKPLAWQGCLIYGPANGGRVTFTSPQTWLPGWQGLPEPGDAAKVVIPAYLGAFGPASAETFRRWLDNGASPMATVRRWFADLTASGTLTQVDVDGMTAYARTQDVAEIAACELSSQVRLLPAFDQYVLGPGTGDASVIAPARRSEISRTSGWISPVVLAGGQVAGTWQAAGGVLDVALFAESGEIPAAALASESARIGAILGSELRLAIRQT